MSVSVGWVFGWCVEVGGFNLLLFFKILIYWRVELTFLVVREIEEAEITERLDP